MSTTRDGLKGVALIVLTPWPVRRVHEVAHPWRFGGATGGGSGAGEDVLSKSEAERFDLRDFLGVGGGGGPPEKAEVWRN